MSAEHITDWPLLPAGSWLRDCYPCRCVLYPGRSCPGCTFACERMGTPLGEWPLTPRHRQERNEDHA